MGAYYAGAINDELYSSWDKNSGAKLLEHSYIGNLYVESVLHLLLNSPQELRWVCDYHENDNGYTWDDLTRTAFPEDEDYYDTNYYVLNHSKDVFIDIPALVAQHVSYNLMIHPITLLCNSEKQAAGDGDFQCEWPLRGDWYGDIIELSYEIPEGMLNVTKDMYITEEK